MTETSIILAVIGCVGLLSTLAVVSRGFRANDKYEQYLGKRALCDVCTDDPCSCSQ